MTEPGQPTRLPMDAGDGFPERFWDNDEVPIVDDRSADNLATGLVDLSFVRQALGRSKRVWCSIAVVGLVIGVGLFLYFKPPYSTTVSVLLRADPNIDAPTSMETASVIAQEPAVVQLADHELGLPVSTQLHYTVAVFNNQVLNITMSAPTSQQAAHEAETVANAFLTERADLVKSQMTATLNGIASQVTQAQNNYNQVNSEYEHIQSEPSSTSQQSQLKRMESKLSAAENALSTLTYQQTEEKLNSTEMVTDSSIISTSVPKTSSSLKRYGIELGAGAFFGGLVIGISIVVIRALLSDRLYRRDDVAVAINAPVRLSVLSAGDSKRRKRHGDARSATGGRHPDEKAADLARVVAHLRESLPEGVSAPSSLVVVAVDDPAFVADAVAELAASLAREGSRVGVADLADGIFAGGLIGTEPGIRLANIGGTQITVVVPRTYNLVPVGPRDQRITRGLTRSREIAAVYEACDFFLTVVVLDPAVGAGHLSTWAADAVAVVTAGQSTVGKVQAVGEMIRDGGTRLVSAILLGADKGDESFGLVKA